MVKEGYDDFKRYKKDKQENSEKYEVIDEMGIS